MEPDDTWMLNNQEAAGKAIETIWPMKWRLMKGVDTVGFHSHIPYLCSMHVWIRSYGIEALIFYRDNEETRFPVTKSLRQACTYLYREIREGIDEMNEAIKMMN